MQFTIALVAAVAALTSASTTPTAYVKNLCDFPIYIQSATNGQTPSTIYTIAANTGVYSEVFKTGGTAIKIGTTSALSSPLTFEYTPSGSTVYYDLSSNAGNPFAAYPNNLTPADTSCPAVHCAANDASCYSTGASPKVLACESTFSLDVHLCTA